MLCEHPIAFDRHRKITLKLKISLKLIKISEHVSKNEIPKKEERITHK